MFIAKFQQVAKGAKGFKADGKNNWPYIGTVFAGTAQGTIINGTIFSMEGLKPNVSYACQNVIEDYQGKAQVRTQVIGEVSLLEMNDLMDQLGPANLQVLGKEEAAE